MNKFLKFSAIAASVTLVVACGGGGGGGVATNSDGSQTAQGNIRTVNSSAGTVASTIILVMN